MNPENAIGNLGIALGLLASRGNCYVTIDGLERYLTAETVPGIDADFVDIDDVLLILQAEEVR